MQITVDRDLSGLQENLSSINNLERKLELVKNFPAAKNFLARCPGFRKLLTTLPEKKEYVLCCLLAIGQGDRIFPLGVIPTEEELNLLLQQLLALETFYENIGGIIGYHLTCLRLLAQKQTKEKKGIYHVPIAENIAAFDDAVRSVVIEGIRNLPFLAEMYPVGGAADRLSIRDEITGAFQIAATLEFAQKTLLEWLIDDLTAREFLYWKLFQKQICVPIVLMTSDEKQGTYHLQKMLSEKNWFGRSRKDFFLFSQPLVPTMNPKGQWCLKGPFQLLLKPGGHGVIWKLAEESGALEWLEKKGKTKALMRQINNVIAGVDYGLLAFLGVGFSKDKDFGFASCARAQGVSEGVNVVIETKEGFSLTNIEYCDQKHFQVEDENLLANTNLLFVDLKTIQSLLPRCPIPGMLVNAKKMKYKNYLGQVKEEEILRLESMMQNIADVLIDKEMMTRTYITSNDRAKTISTIKKEFAFGSSMLQTPEQCYIDLLKNARDLLVNYCDFEVPPVKDTSTFFLEGPSFIFLYHPALGPQYEIISQKMKGGRLAMGSSVKMYLADLYVEHLDVDGSFHITSDAVMGHRDEEGTLKFSDRTGKCILHNVKVRNSGINREASRSFWKDEIVHKEKCEIIIEEGGEFFAEDVVFRGDLRIRVPSGVKVTACMKEGKLQLKEEIISQPSWKWQYSISQDNRILTQRISLKS